MVSENNKGNPYHDEQGRFTSKDSKAGGGTSEREEAMKLFGLDGSQKYETTRDLAYALGWKPSKDADDVMAAGEFVEKMQDSLGEDLDFWMSVRRSPKYYKKEDLERYKEIDDKIKNLAAQEQESSERSAAMKVFDGEQPEWKRLGYEEPIVDVPGYVRRKDIDMSGANRVYAADVTGEDVLNYLKDRGVEVDDRTREYITESGVMPQRVLDAIGHRDMKEFQEDFDEYMEGKIDDDAWEELY